MDVILPSQYIHLCFTRKTASQVMVCGILSWIAVVNKLIVLSKRISIFVGKTSWAMQVHTNAQGSLYRVSAGFTLGMVMYMENGSSPAIVHFFHGYSPSWFRGLQGI